MNNLENTKECYKCKVIKPLDEYYTDNSQEDGLNITCKKCKRAYKKEQYKKNKKKINARSRAWRGDNSDKVAEKRKAYYRENKEELLEYSKKYQKGRYSEDLNFRFRINLRTQIYRIFKGVAADQSAEEVLGCSVKKARKYLSSNSPEGFTWDQYGPDWHIGCQIPLAAFDLTDKIQRRAAGHYSNLHILSAEEKSSKSNTLPEGFNMKDHLENFKNKYTAKKE